MFKKSFAFTVIVLLLVVCLLLVFCSACSGGKAENAGGDKAAKESDAASRISYVTTSHPGMIHIEWKPAKGAGQADENTGGSEKDDDNAKEGAGQADKSVSRYEIYRKDVTGAIYTSDDVPFEEYDKVGSVSGEQTDFDDKDVTNGRYYTYVIRGFDGDKIICDSFSRNVTQYECAGLAKPELIDNGYGENYVNGPDCLYLYVQIDGGMAAESIELYRKAKGEDRFSLAEAEVTPSGTEGTCFEIFDTHVRPHVKYTYRVRTVANESGESVKSKFSNTVKLSAINFVGKYKVTEIQSDPDKKKLTLKVKSDENNGLLRIDKNAQAVLTIEDGSDEELTYDFTLDQKKVIRPGREVSLEFTLKGSKIPDIDGLKAKLNIEDEGIRYDVFGWYTALSLDLARKSGTVFADYDN